MPSVVKLHCMLQISTVFKQLRLPSCAFAFGTLPAPELAARSAELEVDDFAGPITKTTAVHSLSTLCLGGKLTKGNVEEILNMSLIYQIGFTIGSFCVMIGELGILF